MVLLILSHLYVYFAFTSSSQNVPDPEAFLRDSKSSSNVQAVDLVKAEPMTNKRLEDGIEHNYTFHSWGPEGIEFDPILRFINSTYYQYNNTERDWYVKLYGPFGGFVAMHNGSRPMLWIPKKVLKRRSKPDIVNKRLKRMLPRFQHALKKVLFDYPHRFQPIFRVLEKVGSFPVVFQLDDYWGCLNDNYNMSMMKRSDEHVKKSLPTMSLCRQNGCNYSFPIPGYTTYHYATIPKDGTWEQTMNQWQQDYPRMEQKIKKAFWRGSCGSGDLYHRSEFAQQVLLLDDAEQYLDVKATGPKFCPPNFLVVNATPPTESMRYRAVLDIDGNSWSERFPRLLCYNSVVIKVNVEPDHDEYFMPSLTPGVHFLPASIDNYTEVSKWAVDDANLPQVSQIIDNANEWCKRSMRSTRLNYDFLTILNGIIEGLNDNDPEWIDRWGQIQNSYLGQEVYSAHEGFAFRVWPYNLLNPAPDMQGLLVTKLSEMTEKV